VLAAVKDKPFGRPQVGPSLTAAARDGHLFSGDECKFVEQQSRCEVTFSAGSPEFAALVNGFVKGRNAKVTVADAGVMKMDHAVSLKGVARLLSR
jgi:hypothetical protein